MEVDNYSGVCSSWSNLWYLREANSWKGFPPESDLAIRGIPMFNRKVSENPLSSLSSVDFRHVRFWNWNDSVSKTFVYTKIAINTYG